MWKRIALIGILIATAWPAQALDDTATARRKYDALAVRVLAGDETVDWRELRLAAVVAGVNGDFDWREADKRAQTDINEDKYDAALAEALSITRHNIANAQGHFDAFVAYKHLGRDADQAKERAMLNGILNSISSSGDGKSAATAWFTVDPSEEYIYMGLVLKLHPRGQALVQQDGHAYDKMTAAPDTGPEQTIWFNTDTDMQMMARALGEK
jgi:hypothetical protein